MLADKLCQIHPWAECCRFARTGGETAAVAARIARATTDRSGIAICGYSGWTDWYIAVNLGQDESQFGKVIDGMQPWGVPRELRGTSQAFHFDDFEEFDRVIRENRGKLAAVVMEPVRWTNPAPGYLQHIRDVCTKEGILLIYDEITAGWRFTLGGSHKIIGINPDIALFAKAMSNGHPCGAVVGTKEAMSGANKAFISSTYWTERVGSAAALATIAKMEKIGSAKTICDVARDFMSTMPKIAAAHGIEYGFVNCMEWPCLVKPKFANADEALFFTEQMLLKGFMHSDIGFDPTVAHTPEIRQLFYTAADEVFDKMAAAKKAGTLHDQLITVEREKKKGFGRLNH
jgi:glutamate-1-semialdehyde 2,1-aminomutase